MALFEIELSNKIPNGYKSTATNMFTEIKVTNDSGSKGSHPVQEIWIGKNAGYPYIFMKAINFLSSYNVMTLFTLIYINWISMKHRGIFMYSWA